MIAAAAIVPLLWFGPDLLGAGGALGASHTARGVPSPGSAKLADIPGARRARRHRDDLTLPALLAALLAAVLGGPLTRRIFAAAAAWVVIVAVMTAAGYAGNPRYLVAAAALGAALAGAGAVLLATRAVARLTGRGRRGRGARRPRPRGAGRRPVCAAPLGALVLVAAVLLTTGGTLRDQWTELGARAAAADAFDPVIAQAGGRDALVALLAHPDQHPGALARRLAARPADARPRRPAGAARRSSSAPSGSTGRAWNRRRSPASSRSVDDAVLADRRGVRPAPQVELHVSCPA